MVPSNIDNIKIGDMVNILVYGGEIFIFIIMVIYLVFAFVSIRRLKIMNLNLKTPYNKFFSLVANLHFVATFIVVVLTFMSL